MNEVETPVVTLEEQRNQLDRILRSDVFKAARSLQRFLEYVGAKTLAGLSEDVKEYAIGTEVFGRASDYDPRIDTVVRVQALRLREKIREYYEREGAADEIIIAIPKGHYIPFFSRRTPHALPEFSQPSFDLRLGDATLVVPETSGSAVRRELSRKGGLNIARLVALIAVAALFFVVGYAVSRLPGLLSPGERVAAEISRGHVAPAALGSLWAGFLNSDSLPLVAYCNDVFLKTESSDLLRIKSQEVGNLGAVPNSELAKGLSTNPRLLMQAGQVSFDDTYTGTGEVMGVYYLTQMFAKAGASIAVKRSRLLTTDDLNEHDLIFLGSIRENALLAGLPLIQDFVFDWPPSSGIWKGRIANLHPLAGEASSYQIERDSKTHVLRTDYALVSFLPGVSPNRRIVVLAGMTTLGTQAAVEFATSSSGIAQLTKHLLPTSTSNKIPPYFQALLKVDVMRGEVLNVNYVTAHTIRPTGLPQKN